MDTRKEVCSELEIDLQSSKTLSPEAPTHSHIFGSVCFNEKDVPSTFPANFARREEFTVRHS